MEKYNGFRRLNLRLVLSGPPRVETNACEPFGVQCLHLFVDVTCRAGILDSLRCCTRASLTCPCTVPIPRTPFLAGVSDD